MGGQISDWSALEAYLRTAHREFRSHAGTHPHCRIAYAYEGADVPIGFYLATTPSSASWISMNMKVCPLERFRSRSALVANTDLPFGGLVIVPDNAALQQKLPLRNLTVEILEHAMRALAAMRAELDRVAALEDADIEVPYAYVFR